MERLRRLEREWQLFKTGPGLHYCLMEEVGVCLECESYQEMAGEIWQELQEERAILPGYFEAQSKQRLACTCRDMDQPLRIDLYTRIVSFASLVNDRSNRGAAAGDI